MPHHESELQTLFISTIGGLKTSMKNAMKKNGIPLSPLYFMVLKNIHETENCTANYLADITERDKGQITRLIQDVVNQQLVVKFPNPKDKRSQFLQLTEKGLSFYLQLAEADQAILKEMRTDVSDQELKVFLDIGTKMLSNLNAINHKV